MSVVRLLRLVVGRGYLPDGADDQVGDQRRLLAGCEEAPPGDGDDPDLWVGLQGASFFHGDTAVAAFAVDDPGGYTGGAQTSGNGAVPVQVLQVFADAAAHDFGVVLLQFGHEDAEPWGWKRGISYGEAHHRAHDPEREMAQHEGQPVQHPDDYGFVAAREAGCQ